jgi:hypothetical protein
MAGLSDRDRTPYHITFLCILVLLPLCGCQHAQFSTCPIKAQEVLRDLNITDVNQGEVVAWTTNLREVVVTGRRGSSYALIVACHSVFSPNSPWELAATELLLSNDENVRCEWTVGDRSYEHPPTRDDINEFLDYIHISRLPDEVYVFREDVK